MLLFIGVPIINGYLPYIKPSNKWNIILNSKVQMKGEYYMSFYIFALKNHCQVNVSDYLKDIGRLYSNNELQMIISMSEGKEFENQGNKRLTSVI